MRFFCICLIASMGLTSASPVSAARDTEATEKDRRVCRSILRTGTRFPKRICRKQSEWREIEEHGVETLREVHARPVINCTSPSGGPC